MDIKGRNSILNVEKLTIGYKSKKKTIEIYKNINFSLNTGELTAIVGANGIGKSTLLRTLSSVQPALSGHIYLNEKDLYQYTVNSLATHLSIVLTEHLAAANLTVKELIALGRQPYTNWIGTLTENDIKIIKGAIEMVQLDDLTERKCFELSDGQVQKVMIARALAQNTSLMILDEPTTHLDIYHKAYILKLLKKIAKSTQKTVLFSTHEIDLAIQLCDKIIVMNTDEIVIDSPENLIAKGSFSKLFPEDIINFDQNTGSFRLYK